MERFSRLVLLTTSIYLLEHAVHSLPHVHCCILLGDTVQLLILVDQHAADERIRLESYLQGISLREIFYLPNTYSYVFT